MESTRYCVEIFYMVCKLLYIHILACCLSQYSSTLGPNLNNDETKKSISSVDSKETMLLTENLSFSLPLTILGFSNLWCSKLLHHMYMFWNLIFLCNYRLGPAQDVHFFYTRSHLSALQSCALIFSTNF